MIKTMKHRAQMLITENKAQATTKIPAMLSRVVTVKERTAKRAPSLNKQVKAIRRLLMRTRPLLKTTSLIG